MMPRVFQPDPGQSIFYAVGYGGNGVSFSAHAGRRVTERIAGRQSKTFELPIYNSGWSIRTSSTWCVRPRLRRFAGWGSGSCTTGTTCATKL